MPAKTVKLAARVSLVYSLLAALWILVSDWLVQAWFPEALEITYFQTCKGLAFVGVTALLLYALVRDQLRQYEAEAAERQRAEVKLRESESQFRQITESLPQLVWTCTPDGECDFLSQQWVEFTGVPAHDQLGRRWLQQIHPDDRARIAAAWQASVAGGLPLQTEVRIRHRDGTYRWFDDRAVPLRNAAGHIVKWYGSNTDIQAQHALRESLAREIEVAEARAAQLADISRAARASEEKLRAIFEVEPQCLKLLEADGTLREINPAGLAMLEVENPAAVLGQDIIRCILPADHANVRAALEATARGAKRTLEFQMKGGHGTVRWMEMNTVPFHDPATGKAMILGVSRDITERRRAEQQVIQSEMRLHLVWEHALLALRLADAEGNTVLVNPAYCETVGKPRAELQGQSFAIAYAEKDRPQALADYRQRFQSHLECRQRPAFAGPKPTTTGPAEEATARRRPAEVTYWNGRRAQLEVSDSFLEITGQPTLLLTLINDVTLRQRAERRVAVLAEMTRALNTATSRRAACEIIVEAAQKLLGWDACYFHRYNAETQDIENILSRDTLNGQIVDVPMPGGPTAQSPFTQAILREGPRLILRQGPKPAAEKLIPFGDIGRRSESLMFVPVRESGRTIGILSIQSYTPRAYDAASLATLQNLVEHGAGALDRIQSREVLQTREQQFRSLIENTSDMVAVVSPDGRLGFQSPSVERVLGYRPEELTGRNVMDLIHPEDVAAARAALARAMTSLPKPKPFEGRVRHRDGSWRRLQTVGRRALEGSGAKYPASGPDPSHPAPDTSPSAAAIILNARDVTESRALEEQFLQSQRMDAIGQLAGGVAHDFNNLLAIIQMQVDQLKLERDHTPAQEEFANEIGKAAQRGANLTRQLLMFSRRQPAKLSDLDLNEVVGRVMKLLQRLLGADVRMQVNYAPHPLPVHADNVMVDQVLLNLAVNARDAMPRGGRLIIEISAVEFDSTRAAQFPPARPGRFACLSVSDNGKGIRPDILPHIFEPFFTTKAVGKGTGLGLATVFGIVQQHEGWINVASELGAGTTFRLYLPLLTQSSAEPVATTPASAPQPGHETILLAEDEAALRELVHTILSRLGYRVLEAPSGGVALKLWEDHRHEIQLLLTDIVMPDGVNGLELAQRLLAKNPNLKVIFMSGYSQDIAGPAMTLVEGENFLAKPFQAAQLVRLIRAQLESPTIPVSALKIS